MLQLGIDSGSTTTKGVLVENGEIVEKILFPTSARPQESILNVYQHLHRDGVDRTITTGYGRELLGQADKKVTEITCHAKGAAYLKPGIQAIIDVGGQDCKAILLNQHGQVIDFLMNDKCAAGTGRFIEMMMRTLDAPIEELDQLVQGHTPANISSMCTVFAESEIVSLLATGAEGRDSFESCSFTAFRGFICLLREN